MKKLLKKIKDFFKNLFGLTSNSNEEDFEFDEALDLVDIIKQPKVEATSKEDEPEKNDLSSSVQTFLWKPVADHNPFPVVVVSADGFKTNDLQMEILGKSDKVLKVGIQNTGRANKLGHMKYARIHFRINRTAKDFNKSSPLKVRFFVLKNKKRIDVKVMGKNHMVIKSPTGRIDLK